MFEVILSDINWLLRYLFFLNIQIYIGVSSRNKALLLFEGLNKRVLNERNLPLVVLHHPQ